jgi:hypothetical protein
MKLLAFSDSQLLLEYLDGPGGEVRDEDANGGIFTQQCDGGEGHILDRSGLDRILPLLKTEYDDVFLGIPPQQKVAIVPPEVDLVNDVRDRNHSGVYIEYGH